jgi:hypothetical protein
MSSAATRRRAIVACAQLVALVVSTGARGEPPMSPAAAAKRDANARNLAELTEDFDTFVRYTHPAVVQSLGGRDKFIGWLRKVSASRRAEGYRIVESSAAEPLQIVKAGDELHAVLPLKHVTVREKHGELHSPGYLLGVSDDGGRTWKFINGSALTEKDLRNLLPNYNRKLKLPAHKPSTYVPK